MLTIHTFYFNPYRECTYVVSNEQGQCLIVDPGMYNEREEQRLNAYLTDNRLHPFAILITHTHPDHICGLRGLMQRYPELHIVDLHHPADDTFWAQDFPVPTVIPTPGHKEDCVCFYFPAEQILFSGDTLFQESVGRTDLDGGDFATLQQSLQTLMQLPEPTTVYPGHAYPTTIEHEKRHNPYIH